MDLGPAEIDPFGSGADLAPTAKTLLNERAFRQKQLEDSAAGLLSHLQLHSGQPLVSQLVMLTVVIVLF